MHCLRLYKLFGQFDHKCDPCWTLSGTHLSVPATVGHLLSCCTGTEQLFTSNINPSVVTRTFDSTQRLILFQIMIMMICSTLIHHLAVEVRDKFYTKHVCEARDQKEDCKHSGRLEKWYCLEWLWHECHVIVNI